MGSFLDPILDTLALDDWNNVSNEIDIAKGKNELPMSIKDAIKQVKRKRGERAKKKLLKKYMNPYD